MTAAEIRQSFLNYFAEHGHAVRPSSSLVPSDDPTLLFTNAGMVQFKRVFLGQEAVDNPRAVTSQKCVRAGGKHNDLEEVGRTARHHTFFEMLGNFSFGDYFKRDAVRFAWEYLTDVLGLDPERLYATVHTSDDEAEGLWQEVAGLPAERIFRLGDKDNFWQMADTGPCGPCSEVHFDLRPEGERTPPTSAEAFEELAEDGRMIELWNLVFMQFDRDASGTLNPLPAPSIDTGAGLERLAAVLQGVDSNYHTDLFRPLLDAVAKVVGRPYEPASESEEAVSYRVIADHARAVAFLLADGVFPSNEGRGYVLRRILRRGVRHAWLLGRRSPTLVDVVEAVIDEMSDTFGDLATRRDHILATVRAEEERFLSTIEGGLERFDHIAPKVSADRRARIQEGVEPAPVVSGSDAFRLYDTFGFPLDLTDLIAEERGYTVDHVGFDAALEEQRSRSREGVGAVGEGGPALGLQEWTALDQAEQRFVGWDQREVDTRVLAFATLEDTRVALVLADDPFYAEGGGQVSDRGLVEGDGWSVPIERVGKDGTRIWVAGALEGVLPSEHVAWPVHARVAGRTRHDTERNHTATHLLHAALRSILGTHVVQKGSRVEPDRLRFDFAHGAPMSPEEVAEVEDRVNEGIFDDHPVQWQVVAHEQAVARGAMALFGEKYGDEVRVVEIPDVSLELCGGTHVRHTGEIGVFRILSESGVAAGVRRIEAVTGPGVLRHMRHIEERLEGVAQVLKSTPDHVRSRAERLLAQVEELEALLSELRESGGAGESVRAERTVPGPTGEVAVRVVDLKARDADDARAYGDAFREQQPGVAVVSATFGDGKQSLFTFVSDELVSAGIRADALIREVASLMGTSGGGRPHMAQAGVGDPDGLEAALAKAPDIVEVALREASS